MTSSNPLIRSLAVLALLLVAACAPGRQVLVETTSEDSASEVIVNLGEFGIPARKQKGEGRGAGWLVTVPGNELHKAHKILLTLGLPRAQHSGFENMLAETGVIPSKANEHARLVFATSEELASTLEEHEQVVGARVHIVLPEDTIGDRIGSDRPKRPTASVLLRYVPGTGIEIGDEDSPAARRRDAEKAAKTEFQSAYKETLDQVFQDIAENTDGKLQVLLVDIVRDAIDGIRERVSDRAERIVSGHMTSLRAAIEARLEERAQAYRDGGEMVFKSEVADMRRELETTLDLLGKDMTGNLRDTLDEFFAAQAGSLGRDFEGQVQTEMAALVDDRTKPSQLAATLGIAEDDPVEVKFFKLMLQDYFSLPQTIQRIAERRTQQDPAGLPYPSDDVRMLVAHAVEGMWPWDVNVVFSPIEGPAVRARSGDAETDEGAEAPLETIGGDDLAQFGEAGQRNELESNNARLVYLAMALGATTVLLLVLLTRERSRNTALRREVAAATAA